MLYTEREKGQSLMEVLFAIAIFSMCLGVFGYVLIGAERMHAGTIRFTEARLIAGEGIEAVRAIRDRDFGELTPGTYEVLREGGEWVLGSPDTPTHTEFRRTLVISEREDGVFAVASTVLWESFGREHEMTLESILTDWRGSGDESSSFSVGVGSAALTETGNTLTGVVLGNTGTREITFAGMVVTWNNGEVLERVEIDGEEIFPAGTPVSGVSSGSFVDTEDRAISPGAVRTITGISFSGPMAGGSMVLQFILGDGTTASVTLDF